MSLPSILNAPKGVVIDDAGSHWSITVSTQSPVAAFYLFFMLFWSVGILSVLVNLIAARMALLSLTSVVLSVFFLIAMLYCWLTVLFFAGHYKISVANDTGSLFIGVSSFGYRRVFHWSNINQVQEIDNYINRRYFGFNKKKIQISGVRIYKFGMLLNDECRQFVIDFLQNKLTKNNK